MIESYSLRNAVFARINTLSEIQQQMERLQQQELLLREQLLIAAPEKIHKFLEEEGTVNDLFRYGQSSRKIVYGDNPYGFKKSADVTRAFKSLLTAWKNSVRIELSREPHRVEVRISIL